MKKNWSRKRYDAILEDIEAGGGWQEIDESELEGDAFSRLNEKVEILSGNFSKCRYEF